MVNSGLNMLPFFSIVPYSFSGPGFRVDGKCELFLKGDEMKTACQILLLLLLGGCISIGSGNRKTVNESEPADTYIVVFEPVAPFSPQTSRELLEAFNENHPPGVRTHRYRTRVGDNMLTGLICVDSEQGKNKVAQMLQRSDRLKLVRIDRADEKKLEAHYKLGQPSLSQASSSSSRPRRLTSKGQEMEWDISGAPETIEKVCSDLDISVNKVDSKPGSHTYVGRSLGGLYIKIEATAVVRDVSYVRVEVDSTSPVGHVLQTRVLKALQ